MGRTFTNPRRSPSIHHPRPHTRRRKLYVKNLVIGSLGAHDTRSPKWPLDEGEGEEGEMAETDLVDIAEGLGDRLFAKVLAVQRTLYPRRHRKTDYDSEICEQSCHDIASGDIQEAARKYRT